MIPAKICNPFVLQRANRAFGLLKFFLAFSLLGIVLVRQSSGAAERPNIVLIYADDLGYGDTGCYGATAVQTPHIDRLAREGLRFTDAHSAAATCTPSRYAMLTGEYAFRQKGTGILRGDAALIIKPGRVTLPSILQAAGYTTGVVGKWHLGLGEHHPDWNTEIQPGPLEIGFNSCFIIPATGDRTPCVFVENHRVVGYDANDPIQVNYDHKVGNEPTGAERPDLLTTKPSEGHNDTIVNGIGRIGFMSGGKAARWKDEDIADVITQQAVNFIKTNKEGPFFLYFATHDVHVPRVPHPRFRGATKMGPRGDAIAEFDWSVGQILQTLDDLGLASNTLVIFSSDNGPVVDNGYQDESIEKLGSHKPAGPLRGGKSTPFEGGTREPFIVRWPNHVPANATSSALVGQIDLLASLAALTDQKLPKKAAPDSVNVLPALLGKSREGRDTLVEQGHSIALRQKQWKYIEPAKKAVRSGAVPQLYNLAEDLAEERNLAEQEPAKLKELARQLDAIRKSGRMP